MRYFKLGVVLAGLALFVWLFFGNGLDRLAIWAIEAQRETQRSMALALRAIKAGEAGAVLTLMGLCFAYGLAHAAGPGHGKMLLGAYGVASQATLRRLTVLAFASSLVQSLSAILIVSVFAAILGFGRDQIGLISDQFMNALSLSAIALVGAWLFSRGVRRAMKQMRPMSVAHSHNHGHDHGHNHSHHDHDHTHKHSHNHSHQDHTHDGETCSSCGHRHGPTLREVEQVHSFRDAVLLVLSIGMRPCTGAVFVLLLTYQMGIPMIGIAAVLAMGIGTGMVTAGVAVGAGFWRQNALPVDGARAEIGVAALELLMGALVVIVSLALLFRGY